MAEQYANQFFATTLTSAINSATLTIPVASVSGLPATGPFRVTVDAEIILIDSRSGLNLTANASGRGYESSGAASHTAAAAVVHALTKGSLDAILSDTIATHNAALDPHPGYTTAAELTTALASYLLIASLFDDAEGQPANLGGASADGTSAFAARRDHRHPTVRTANDVDASETTTSTSYVNLTTTEAITLTPGFTADHLLLYSCLVKGSSGSTGPNYSPSIASIGTPFDADGLYAETTVFVRTACNTLATGQTSGGTHTLKAKVGTGTGTFLWRQFTGVVL
jgi:hypothetical protein